MSYYNNGSQLIDGIHDTSSATHINDMPEESRQWFNSAFKLPEGKEWKHDPERNIPVLVDVAEPTSEQLEQQKHREWKAARQEKVNNIKVTIDGLTFDGDETSQGRTVRAATLAESPEETIQWILADNSVATVTADQLRRAAQAAWIKQRKLWILEKTDVEKKEIQPAP